MPGQRNRAPRRRHSLRQKFAGNSAAVQLLARNVEPVSHETSGAWVRFPPEVFLDSPAAAEVRAFKSALQRRLRSGIAGQPIASRLDSRVYEQVARRRAWAGG